MMEKHISLTLYPDSFAVKERLCHLAADFMAQYYRELFEKLDPARLRLRHEEFPEAVSYILSELISGAVHWNRHGEINLTVGLGLDDLVCLVSTQVQSTALPALRACLTALACEDREVLLAGELDAAWDEEPAAARAAADSGDAVGVGRLALLYEYGVTLGWRLDPLSRSVSRVQAMAKLPMWKQELASDSQELPEEQRVPVSFSRTS